MKEAAYKGLVRPVLEYGSSVWDPHTHVLQEELEKVQNREARFVTGNYVFETGSMTGILGQLKWESLKKRRKDSRLKLVSHWHANSSRLLREFSRGTFARHSCECRENFHVWRTSRELVAKVLNMFKNWRRIFFPKYFARRLSRDCRATVVRRSCDVRANVANLSPRNFGEFTMRNFRDTRTNVVLVSHDSRATVLRQHAKNSRLSGEKIKLSDIHMNDVNVARLSYELK